MEALRNDAKSVSVDVTINMTYENGQWWIVSDSALLDRLKAVSAKQEAEVKAKDARLQETGYKNYTR